MEELPGTTRPGGWGVGIVSAGNDGREGRGW